MEDEDVPARAALTSQEVNVLVYHYLCETGLPHSAFSLLSEGELRTAYEDGQRLLDLTVPPNQLIRILHKGLLYIEAEAKWNGGNARQQPPRLLNYDLQKRDSLDLIFSARPKASIPREVIKEAPETTREDNQGADEGFPQDGLSQQRTPSAPRESKEDTDMQVDVNLELKEASQPASLTNGVHLEKQTTAEQTHSPPLGPSRPSTDRPTSPAPILLDHRPAQSGANPDLKFDSRPTPSEDTLQTLPTVTIDETYSPIAGNKRKERASPAPSSSSAALNPDVDASTATTQTHSAPMSRVTSANSVVNGVSKMQPEKRRANSEDRESKRVKLELTDNNLNSLQSFSRQLPQNNSAASPSPEPTSATTVDSARPSATPAQSTSLLPVSKSVTVTSPSTMTNHRPPLSVVTVRRVAALPPPPELQPLKTERRSSSPNVAKSNPLAASGSSIHRNASTGGRATSPDTNSSKRSVSGSKERDKLDKKNKINHQKSKRERDGDSRVDPEPLQKPTGKDPLLGEIKDAETITLKGHTQSVQPCAWNPKVSNMLATGSHDYSARIWDVPTSPGTLSESVICKHGTGSKRIEIYVVAWNPDGTLLATGSEDGIARIYTSAGDLYLVLSMHQRGIGTIKWNQAGTMLLTGSFDGTVCCWELSTGKVKQQFETQTEPVMDCDWFDEQTFVSCGQDRSVHLCVINRNSPIHRFRGHTDEVNACKFDPGKGVLATCSDDRTVRLWSMLDILPNGPKTQGDTPSTEVARNGGSFALEGHTGNVQTIAWHPSAGLDQARARILASASFDNTARIWDADACTCLLTLRRHTEVVYSLSFSPEDGKYLAVGSDDRRASVFRVKDGELICEYVHNGPVYEVLWHPSRNVLAITGQFSDAKVVNVKLPQDEG